MGKGCEVVLRVILANNWYNNLGDLWSVHSISTDVAFGIDGPNF
jgi:hypothetical protein